MYLLLSLIFSISLSIDYQIRISLTGIRHEMIVSFVLLPSIGEKEHYVEWGTTEGNLPNRVYSTYHTYSVDSYSRTVHHAKLTELPFGTIFYRVGNEENSEKSSQFSFEVYDDLSMDEFSFLVIADGTGEKYDEILQYIHDNELDHNVLGIYPGDMAFPRSREEWDEWDVYGTRSEKVNARIPIMCVPGNHDGYGSVWDHYLHRYPIISTSPSNLFYSFDFGPVHFISLSSEHIYYEGTEQQIWLLNDLEKVDRQETPFIVAHFHQPAYTSSVAHASNEFLREKLEWIFLKYRVQLIFNGHVHGYERTCLVSSGECVIDDESNINIQWSRGAVHFVAGTGGRPLHYEWNDNEWSAKQISAWGYMQIDVVLRPEPKLSGKFLEIISSSEVKVRDSFSMTFPKCDGIRSWEYEVCGGTGFCVSSDKCESMFTCEPKCVHGKCTIFHNCSCDEGWTSKFCNRAVCDPECFHGQCRAPQTCTCDDLWTGPTCSVKNIYCFNESDPNSCHNGSCIEQNLCKCKENYYGSRCSSWMCFGFDFKSKDVCTWNGKCIAPNNCSCEKHYYGRKCEFEILNDDIFGKNKFAIGIGILMFAIGAPIVVVILCIVVCLVIGRKDREIRESQRYNQIQDEFSIEMKTASIHDEDDE